MLFSVKRLAAGYKDVVVRDVTFSAEPGKVFAIIGVNGAGKSTILKSIVGEATLFSGEVAIGEDEVTGVRGHALARRGVGYLPQVKDVFPGLSVTENLRMGGFMLPRREIPARIGAMLERFPQLAHKRRAMAHNLSGGERKQLAVARALMPDPRVLLMDEPTANLSPLVAEELLFTQVPELARSGMSIVIVEQRIELVLNVADQGCLIGGGRMQHVATGSEIWDRIQSQGLVHDAS
jgi:branched-chain amino acid transport system ATP-binding protein